MEEFVNGDPVWFLQTCKGGYGFQRNVPATFIAYCKVQCRIRIHLRDGSSKLIYVAKKNITARHD